MHVGRDGGREQRRLTDLASGECCGRTPLVQQERQTGDQGRRSFKRTRLSDEKKRNSCPACQRARLLLILIEIKTAKCDNSLPYYLVFYLGQM